MAKIDSVRRACEDIGTFLAKDKESNKDAIAALAPIHTNAMDPDPENREPTMLWHQLEEFRKKFKIPAKVAASYSIS